MSRQSTVRNRELTKKMAEFGVRSIGKDLCGHFSAEDVVEILKTAKTRGRKPGQVLKESVKLGLPAIHKMKLITLNGHPAEHSAVTLKDMKEWEVPDKGKTMCGFFTPEVAVEIIGLAKSHDLPFSQVIRAAVATGLPLFQQMYPPATTLN